MQEETSKLSGDVAELQDDMSEVKEKLVVHETRFGNGIHVMAEMKSDIEALKPKAPDWLKILLAGLAVIGVLMGAQLWMTDRFDDRPTQLEVEKMTAPIKQAQKETSRDVGDIQKSQAAQQISIKNIETLQSNQGAKIDTLLERIPARRGNH